MKTRGLVMAIIALSVMVSFKVWSHGGRLNSEGCHNDTKAKQYHCHKANAKAGDKTDDRGNKTLGQSSLSGIYNRDHWSFRSSASPLSSSLVGWYTGVSGNATDVDHVVALKDAHLSGGKGWSFVQKRAFANDPLNHVAAVPYVNRTLKSAFKPLKFITKLRHSGYRFAHGRCVAYVNLYIKVKRKYGLSLASNRVDAAKLACQ
ncbi:HNH endonuclease [Oceanospirillaceae bacterium]|nr:HNH endonuclease [Oceanospirillaceae bacterium]